MYRACLGLGLLCGLCTLLAGAEPTKNEEKVELKFVKGKDLKSVVAGQKGKVVVLDFWAHY